jgi:PIN domain nuclease of toxin-antitoxin system
MKSERAAVLDASAILAMLQKETGAEKLTDDVLDRSAVSTVNLAEVQGKLVLKGVAPGEAWMHATAAVESIEAYTGEHAKLAGALIAQTRSLSLSLGDRSCLALAISLKGEVYTTERAWKKLKLGIPIHVIR